MPVSPLKVQDSIRNGQREVLRPTAAVTLTVLQQVVYATPPSASTYIITLPPVAACNGLRFHIVSDGDDTGTITVAADDCEMADKVLTADNDFCLVESNGFDWITVAETLT